MRFFRRLLSSAQRPVVATIGWLLVSIAAAQAQPFAYITNQGSNNVSVMDTATNVVVATFAVGAQPQGVAFNPGGTRAYVGNFGSNGVSVIDTAIPAVLTTIPVGTSPEGVAVNPAGTRAYVVNGNSASMSVIDTATNMVLTSVPVGTTPYAVAINPAGTRAYVTNFDSANVTVIDITNNMVVTTVAVGSSPAGVAVNPADTRVYVTNSASANVSVIDTSTNMVLTTIPVGSTPLHVAINPAGTRAYVTNRLSDNVSVVDTAVNNVVATLAVGDDPFGVAFNPAGTRAYVVNRLGNSVSVIDTGTVNVIATVAVGMQPRNVAVNPTTNAMVPGAPVIGIASAGTGSATVNYTPPAFNGGAPIVSFTATSNPGGITGSATSGPIIVTGLSNGTPYTFTVRATNAVGVSPSSAPSNSVIPGAAAVTVTGTATFPSTVVGASSGVQPITITNSGAATLTLNSITHSNASVFPDTTSGPAPNAAHWCGFGSVASGAPSTGSPINIAAGNSCVFNLIFSPNATGPLSGTVTINSNAPTTPTLIPVSGTGLPPPSPTMTVGFAPASVATSTNSTLTVTLTNPGASPASIVLGSAVNVPGLTMSGLTDSCSIGAFISTASIDLGMAGSIPAMGTCTVTVQAQSAMAGSFPVTVMPGNLVTSQGNNANTSTSTLTVTPVATGPFAYIPNFGSFSGTTVSVIDLPTNTVAATIPVGVGPLGAAVNTAGTRAYIANQQGNSVSVVNTATNTVIATVPVGSQPAALAVNPAGTRVYVPNQSSNSLSVIDTSTNSVIATVTGLALPVGAGVSPSGGKVFVANNSSSTIAIIDAGTNMILTNVPVCSSPYQPVANAAGTRVYVSCVSNAVTVIDAATATVVATIPVAGTPRGIALNPSGTRAYTSNFGGNSFSVIDTSTNTVIATVPAGTAPWGLAVNAAGTRLYVANSGSNNVSVVDTSNNMIVATVPVGVGPVALGQFVQPAAITPAPAVSLAPPSVNFGTRTVNTTSPVSTVTLGNSGTALLTITSITPSGDFAMTTTCPLSPSTLAIGLGCPINITFTPLTVGALVGNIAIVSNAPGSPHTIALSGTGSAVAVPAVSLSTTALNAGNQPVNTPSAVQSIAVTNSGFATLMISGITVTGSMTFTRVNPASPAPNCATSVAPGATCYISVTFTPTATGTFTAQISIASNASGSPHFVNLTGAGVPAAIPAIGVPANIAFGDQVINAVASQVLTIANTGTATLNVSSISLSGTDAARFATNGMCSAIVAGLSCDINITFTANGVGPSTAQITITSDATNLPSATISLSGNGILAPNPVAAVSVTAIGFGNSIIGGATASQLVTVSNTGGVAMQIQSLFTVGDFVQMNSCPSSLASGASCLVNILFTPLSVGQRGGALTLISNAANGPQNIPLSGTGCRWFSQAQSRNFLTICG